QCRCLYDCLLYLRWDVGNPLYSFEQKECSNGHERDHNSGDGVRNQVSDFWEALAPWSQSSLLVGPGQQRVIGHPLPLVAENDIGADDLSEPLRSIGIVQIVVGMTGLGGVAECRSEPVGIIVRKRTE